jgi:GTPase SAR1 family protein
MDILGYLKSVLEDAKAYSRMKLMLVGIQGIGKTTLLSLLRQEGGSQKQGPTDHWAKRMGTSGSGGKGGKSGKPMSTVGVDIGSLTLEGRGGRPAVTFRSWDFGGQREYYATHLYFLSKRSLYLVLWNVCDGERGLNEILQWLVNIQVSTTQRFSQSSVSGN